MSMQFSIIIPAKNEESNIGRCLDSIGQVQWDKSRYEVIVVDNGSSDRTVEIAEQKGATVYVKPELTISGLRNYGASRAHGEILGFLDADCTVREDWLSAAAAYLADRASIVAFGSEVLIPEASTWVQRTWLNVRIKPGKVMKTDWLASANFFVFREAFFSVNGFNESLVTCEDYDISKKLSKLGVLISDQNVAAIHYREPSTINEFFVKELWRGKSNYSGITKHEIDFHELPSLVIPIVHVLMFATFSFLVPFCLLSSKYLLITLSVFVAWQLPIFVLSTIKNSTGSFAVSFQLHALLNVYFLARGGAMFQWFGR